MNETQEPHDNPELLLGATLFLMTQYARVFANASQSHKDHLRVMVIRHLECISDCAGIGTVLHQYCDQLALEWNRGESAPSSSVLGNQRRSVNPTKTNIHPIMLI